MEILEAYDLTGSYRAAYRHLADQRRGHSVSRSSAPRALRKLMSCSAKSSQPQRCDHNALLTRSAPLALTASSKSATTTSLRTDALGRPGLTRSCDKKICIAHR